MHLVRKVLRSLPWSFFSSAWAEQAMPSGVEAFFGTPLTGAASALPGAVAGVVAAGGGVAFGVAAGAAGVV